MIKYKKIKNTLKSAPKMFFDSGFYEKSKQSKIDFEKLSNSENFFKFDIPWINVGYEPKEYEMHTHNNYANNYNNSVHVNENKITKEIFIPTTNFDDKVFNNILQKVTLPSQSQISHSIGKINISSGALVLDSLNKDPIKFHVPNGVCKIVELYDSSYVENIKREKKFEKEYQDTYKYVFDKEGIYKVYKETDKQIGTNLINNSNKEELAEEIRDYIFDEWEVWNPIAPNIHMLYINFN